MVTALRITVQVKAGGVVEVRAPELPPGANAEVIVLVNKKDEGGEQTTGLTREQAEAGRRLLKTAERIRRSLTPGPIKFTRDELHERR
jgi:hypothetical protein